MNTKESIDFAILSKEKVGCSIICRAKIYVWISQFKLTSWCSFTLPNSVQYDERESPGIARSRQGVKIDRIAGILPYVSYEESKRIYGKVHHEISAAIEAVSPKRCNQSLYCADDDQSY